MIPDALHAEEALLGAVIVKPQLLEDVSHLVVPSDFHRPSHAAAWGALVEAWKHGQPLDGITLSSKVPTIDLGMVASWQQAWGGARPSTYVDAILSARARRDIVAVACESRIAALDENLDPFDVRDRMLASLGEIDSPEVQVQGLSTLDEFWRKPSEQQDWIIDGMIGDQWRAIIVASEGKGKMWLMRQIAIAASAGVHPLFHNERIKPIRTLMVDLENPEISVRQSTNRMVFAANRDGDWSEDRCWLWHQPGGIDVRTRRGRSELESAIRQSKPDLVVLGPLYKLYRGGGSDMEAAAHDVQQILDDLRTRHKFSLIIEHHAPKPQNGTRDILPFGSSLWMRWPELGIKLTEAKDAPENSLTVGRWRPDRIPVAWPDRIDYSPGWPWEGFWSRGFHSDMKRVMDMS